MLELPGEKKKSRLPRLFLAVFVALLLGAVFYFVSSDEDEPHEVALDKQQSVAVPSEPEFLSLLPAEAHRLVQEREVVIVDVRSEAERAEVSIPGSISVPLTRLAAGEFELPKEQPVLLVCAVGGRSYGAGLYLMRQGYLQVYNLRGGISAWSKEGLPVEHGTAEKEPDGAEKLDSPQSQP